MAEKPTGSFRQLVEDQRTLLEVVAIAFTASECVGDAFAYLQGKVPDRLKPKAAPEGLQLARPAQPELPDAAYQVAA